MYVCMYVHTCSLEGGEKLLRSKLSPGTEFDATRSSGY